MSDENKNNQDANNQDLPPEGSNKPEQITLSAEAYTALLDRLDELEALGSLERPQPRQQLKKSNEDDDDDDLESIVSEGKKSRGGQAEPELTEEEVNNMSNADLMKLIDQRGSEFIQPIYQRLLENEIKSEIREIRRDKDVRPEFDAYWNLTYKIAKANPEMSVEDAFLLAKVKRPGLYKAPGKKGDEKGNPLNNIPPRPRVYGEKVDRSSLGSESTKPKVDIEDIAAAKFDELTKK